MARVLITEPIAEEGITILRAEADVDIKLDLKPAELISIIGEYEALLVRSETKVTAEVIKAGKKLHVIGRAGVGVDNIDVGAATQKGIVVVNAPAANTVSAAEHTIALMLALARHIPQAHIHLKEGGWKRQNFIGVEVRNKKLGIVGLGNVGSEVSRRAKGLQMNVIAYDPFVSPDYARNLGVELRSFEQLLAESDFISLHLTLTSGSKGLIGSKELAMMKPSVRIINCARGGLIDEQALLQAVEEGRVAGAAVDVFCQEPPVDSPLLRSQKIIVTPHLGASTKEAQTGVALDAAEQIACILSGRSAKYAVNAPLVSAEVISVLSPFVEAASRAGKIAVQLSEGQMSSIDIGYEGEIADCDITILRTAILAGLLGSVSEERINIVNANLIAQRRGLKITEYKKQACENYTSLITVSLTTTVGVITIATTVMRGELHVVRFNNYWFDLVPRGGYFLFSDHLDRPGIIGAVSMVTANADVNISSMQVSRLSRRGQALMVLELDEPLGEEQLRQILAIPDIYTAKVVKL